MTEGGAKFLGCIKSDYSEGLQNLSCRKKMKRRNETELKDCLRALIVKWSFIVKFKKKNIGKFEFLKIFLKTVYIYF